MKGIDVMSVIAGVVLTIGGIGLAIVSIFVPFLIVYAIITLILGIIILTTLKEQEHIEPIKKHRKRKK